MGFYFVCFRAFFAYFDETRCRWETEQDSCDDYVTDSEVTFSGDTDSDTGTNSDSDIGSDTGSDSDGNSGAHTDDIDSTDNGTNVDDESSNDDATNDDSIDSTDSNDTTDATEAPDITTEKPFYQNLECEPLDDTWMCSSGSKNHSLCIKFCTIG